MSHVPAALAILLAFSIGCSSVVAPPGSPGADVTEARAAWERTLSDHVDAMGRVDFDGIAAAPEDLERFVGWVADAPLLEDPGARLADLINAYNALAMYNVVRSGIPASLESRKAEFFAFTKFVVGGREISLRALENDVIRPVGEPRVHFALNCMVRDCPRLPREPFRADALDRQLEAAAREFLAGPPKVRLLPERRAVRFNEILRFYTEDFLTRAPSLVAYANRYRDDPIPTDWTVEFEPYDWTVNRQP